MVRFVLLATLAASLCGACRISIEGEHEVEVSARFERDTNERCIAAGQAAPTLASVQQHVFAANCGASSGCHGPVATESNLLLNKDAATSYAALMGKKAEAATAYNLVTPGEPEASYLMLRMNEIVPFELDPDLEPIPKSDWDSFYMPQNTPIFGLCIEKRELVRNWIADGAKNN